MATLVARPSNPTKVSIGVPGSRYDHFFFSTMAVVMLASVFVGFAHTYYLAGVFHAPLPSLIIHLHGAAFSCWILLLVAQTSFVSTGRVDIHRKLGIAGFLLACLMVTLGVLAATDSLRRGTGPTGLDAQFFYVIPMTDMLIFATLVFCAFRYRSNPAAHKRLILVATTGLLIAAIARWPIRPGPQEADDGSAGVLRFSGDSSCVRFLVDAQSSSRNVCGRALSSSSCSK